jgi:hypothetical protein
MSTKQTNNGREPTHRTAEQRRASATVPVVMAAWESLTDMERLAWEYSGARRRISGVSYFKKVNMRRLLRGQQWIRVPPLTQTYDPRPLLKAVDIRNRGDRITLELQLWRKLDAPRTLWASRPYNRGLKMPRHCPRLGWLTTSKGRWCQITQPYFQKHGEYMKQHASELVGKRIFIRLRPETDDGPNLYEQVWAVVPKPEVKMAKKAPSPTKDLRRTYERPTKPLRNLPRTPSHPRAIRKPIPGGR